MKRYLELDSLRGLAAFAVFTTHAFGLIWNTEIKFAWLEMANQFHLGILWNGKAAVDLFFVLSGFVLALPLIYKRNEFNYSKFLIKRFLRIYPAYWMAMILAVLMSLNYSYGNLEGLSKWINGYWNNSLTFKQIIEQFFLHYALILPGLNTKLINPVIWTLVIEIQISIILPLFIMLLTWNFKQKLVHYAWHFFVFLICLIVSLKFNKYLFYLPLFMLGSFSAYYKDKIIKIVRQSKFIAPVLLLFALYLYGSREFINLPLEYQHHYISALGSALIIILIISWHGLSKITTVKPTIFLGNISYSFYLMHLPVIIFISSIIYPLTDSILLCWLVSLILSIALAYVLYKYVELPCQQLGRKLSNSQLMNYLV